MEKARQFTTSFVPVVDELDDLLSFNKIFTRRTAAVGIIPREMAVDYALSGPNLRGSGIKWDLRKDDPYCGYENYDFDIPVGVGKYGPIGSCWDRYYIRVQEMRESAKIVLQALDRLPEGNVQEKIPKRVKPAKGEVYLRSEAPRGELGFYIVSDGTLKPFRVKARSPCFVAMSIFHEIARGELIADIIALIGSLDIVLGAIDR